MLSPWFRRWLHRQSPRRTARTPAERRSRLLVEALEDRCLLNTYTVTNTNDGGAGSLRRAINDANNNPGPDLIQFSIGSGSQLIEPASELPHITDTVTIDGTSQPGFSGSPLIRIRGASSGQATYDGLTIKAPNCVIEGLVIDRFRIGITIKGSGASGNLVTGCFIGIGGDGTTAQPNSQWGIVVDGGASNMIGGTTAAARNVISDNGAAGVLISGSTAAGNVVEGDFIGVGADGTTAAPNTNPGVNIGSRAENNTIGGTAAGAGNFIADNHLSGVVIGDYDYATNTNTGHGGSNNTILGNTIGLNAAGAVAANGWNGVQIDAGASGNTVGAGNVISGNTLEGVLISGSTTAGNVVQGNLIGTTPSGLAAAANGNRGVLIDGAPNNTIGGTTAADRNMISGNGTDPRYAGVRIANKGATGNVVEGNYIGVGADGHTAVPNSGAGVGIGNRANNNTVGGTAAGAGNVISGNTTLGVIVDDYDPDTNSLTGFAGNANVIQGNLIGVNAAGTTAVANGTNGVQIDDGASSNTVGGRVAASDNVISGNAGSGVRIGGSGTADNWVQGNNIGLNAAGTAAVPNAGDGIDLVNGTTNNRIGGSVFLAGNVISGNHSEGVWITDKGTSGNLVLGNYIGTDAFGSTAVANGGDGVGMQSGASANTIGGTAAGAGNLVSGNAMEGVWIDGGATTGNELLGNTIGLDVTGTNALGNGDLGVKIVEGANGNTVGAGNVISGNAHTGVYIGGNASSGNVVQGSLIGTTPSGLAAVGNGHRGIFIDGAPNNTIGGTTAGARNIIAGNGTASPVYAGILMANSGATGNLVVGNYIGVAADGTTALPNTYAGVRIGTSANHNTIGGTVSGAGNLIDRNGTDSVLIDNWNGSTFTGVAGVGNAILGNTITEVATGHNGIFLTAGGNDGQVAPALTVVGGSSVAGTLTSTPNTSFLIEFFGSAAGIPPEGQTFLARMTVKTDSSGKVSFTAPAGVTTSGGQFVTATATNKTTGDTSEFSAAVPTQTATAPAITSSAGTTFTVGSASSFTVTATGIPTPSLTETGALPSGVTFTDNGNGTATLAGTPAAGSGKVWTFTITASNGVSPNATQTFTLTVNEAPAITSADGTTFLVGSPGSFTVTTTGFPTPSLTRTGTLPQGVAFTDNGTGTATLAGTPAAGSAGTYTVMFTAHNAVNPNAVQTFTLTVSQTGVAPAITSSASTTFTVGSAGSFTVTATGTPTPSVSKSGALPSGVTFTDNGTGTATLAGTPATGSAGTYTLTLTAQNGVGSNATQTFTLTVVNPVIQPPAITSAAGTSFAVGLAGQFTVTATGLPTPSLKETGALPQGVTFTDNGNGTATLAGIPAAGSAPSYTFTITAHNGVNPDAVQTFTLTVSQSGVAPAVTSSAGTTFTVGSAGSFTVTTTGAPTASLRETGALPGGVTFTDNGDGTATLAGAPAVGTGSVWSFTLTASNGVSPDASQTFTLTVDEAPAITSPSGVTFLTGVTDDPFPITATGFPKPSLTVAGTLPTGVFFRDNGNGTGFLAGVPPAGSEGTYVLTITAHNGVGHDATQTFTLVLVAPTVPPPVPAVRPISAQLVTVQFGKKKKRSELMILVLYADTGMLKNEFPSPFQKPAFKNIQVSVRDSNGDGIPDEVVVTALKSNQKRKTPLTVLFPG